MPKSRKVPVTVPPEKFKISRKVKDFDTGQGAAVRTLGMKTTEKPPEQSDPVSAEALELAETEREHWHKHHVEQAYAGREPFEAFLGGYHSGLRGYERFGAQGGRFEDVEEDLRRDYERIPQVIPWEHAKLASKFAWVRAEERKKNPEATKPEETADPVTAEALKVEGRTSATQERTRGENP